MNRRFFFAATFIFLATWFTATSSFSFDIVIYGDPLSEQNSRYLVCRHYGDGCNTNVFVNTDALMDCVYTMYKAMGVTKVMVNYPFQSDFDWLLRDTTGIKVMNWYYPGPGTMHGDKYVDAQFREVQVGYDQELYPYPDPRGSWSLHDAIGDSAEREASGPPNFPFQLRRPVVAMGPGLGQHQGHGRPDTLWRATSELGKFSGWDWYTTGWLDSTLYMPMHFKLTWAVDPNGPIDTSTVLADFYWMVRAPSERIDGVDHDRWWQYPVKTIKLGPSGDVNAWNTSVFVDSSRSGTYNLLDEYFQATGNPSDAVCFERTPHSPIDDYYLPGLAYGQNNDVRMSVYYHGTHHFYLNRIEAYDDGAWRMFAAVDTIAAVADTTFVDSVSVGQALKRFYRVRATTP